MMLSPKVLGLGSIGLTGAITVTTIVFSKSKDNTSLDVEEVIKDKCSGKGMGWDQCAREIIPINEEDKQELEKQLEEERRKREDKQGISWDEYQAKVKEKCGEKISSGKTEELLKRQTCETEISDKFWIKERN